MIASCLHSCLAWPHPRNLCSMQADNGPTPKYRHTLHALQDVWQQGGLAGAYRGTLANASRAVVVTAVQVRAYRDLR